MAGKLISDDVLAELEARERERQDRQSRAYDAGCLLEELAKNEGWVSFMVMRDHVGVTLGRDGKTVYLSRREIDVLIGGLLAAQVKQEDM